MALAEQIPLLSTFHQAYRRRFDVDLIDVGRDEAAKKLDVNHFSKVEGFQTELWRVFNLNHLTGREFNLADPSSGLNHREFVENLSLNEKNDQSFRIVILNGGISLSLSKIPKIKGVKLSLFSELTKEEQINFFKKSEELIYNAFPGDPFVLFNTAAFEQISILHIDPEVVLQTPVHVIYLTDMAAKPQSPSQKTASNQPPADLRQTRVAPPKGTLSHPRLFVSLGKFSKLTLVEEWASPFSNTMNNGVTQIVLDDSSSCEHIRVQQMESSSYCLDRLVVEVGRDAKYHAISASLGAKQSRSDLFIHMNKAGGEANLEGIAVLSDKQESDTHSVVWNAAEHVCSEQLHKMIVLGNAHGVFHGSIRVQPGAQNIKAYQLNRNLILSDKARVDTKPQLEIYADEVECSHGSATGELDEDQLFYLQSRGLDKESAKTTLTFAFGAEVIESIHIPKLRDRLVEFIHQRIDQNYRS